MLFRVAFCAILMLALASCGGGGNSFVPSNSFTPTPTPTPPGPAALQVAATKLSTDTFTNPASQHATEVEPSAFAHGNTIVAAFQVGRINSGGSAAIGFATSLDAGLTWTSGFLPNITTAQGTGTYSAASDPVTTYDVKHGVWLISSLGIGSPVRVQVSRSVDGFVWSDSAVVSSSPDADKNWFACDNWLSSPNFGNCYLEWDDPSSAGRIWMSTSHDGGVTWDLAQMTADRHGGIGGQPNVLPTGRVVVPIADWTTNAIISFISDDGGATWASPLVLSAVIDHQVAGNLRAPNLPSVAMDGAGKLYVTWQDCRFRSTCTANDIVFSTSTDGLLWTSPARIPIDATTSGVDHFLAAMGVDPQTSGASAHLALTYYFYANAACTAVTCSLGVGLITSGDGGATWSAPKTLASSMSLASLPTTISGSMVGDYFATVYANGQSCSVFTFANTRTGPPLDEAIYAYLSPALAVQEMRVNSSRGELPVPNARSDHEPAQFYDLERRYRVPPPK
jgi:hypothetical protein